jgi:hypothetical protein
MNDERAVFVYTTQTAGTPARLNHSIFHMVDAFCRNRVVSVCVAGAMMPLSDAPTSEHRHQRILQEVLSRQSPF